MESPQEVYDTNANYNEVFIYLHLILKAIVIN